MIPVVVLATLLLLVGLVALVSALRRRQPRAVVFAMAIMLSGVIAVFGGNGWALEGERVTLFLVGADLASNSKELATVLAECGPTGRVGLLTVGVDSGSEDPRGITWVDAEALDPERIERLLSGAGEPEWSLGDAEAWPERLARLAHVVSKQMSSSDFLLGRKATIVLLWDGGHPWGTLRRAPLLERDLKVWSTANVEFHVRDVRRPLARLTLDAWLADGSLATQRSALNERLYLELKGRRVEREIITARTVNLAWNLGGAQYSPADTGSSDFWSETDTRSDVDFEADSGAGPWRATYNLSRKAPRWQVSYHRLDIEVQLEDSPQVFRKTIYVEVRDRRTLVLTGKGGSRLSTTWSDRNVPGGMWRPQGQVEQWNEPSTPFAFARKGAGPGASRLARPAT